MLATFAAKPQWSTINTFYRTQNLLQCQISLYSLPERMIEMLLAKINESFFLKLTTITLLNMNIITQWLSLSLIILALIILATRKELIRSTGQQREASWHDGPGQQRRVSWHNGEGLVEQVPTSDSTPNNQQMSSLERLRNQLHQERCNYQKSWTLTIVCSRRSENDIIIIACNQIMHHCTPISCCFCNIGRQVE